MAIRAFTSVTAGLALVAAATALVAATVITSADAYKPAAGKTCKCALAASAGQCIVVQSFSNKEQTRGTCKTSGHYCDVPWECTDNAPTHVCMAHAVRNFLRCEELAEGGTCPCAKYPTSDVTLRPTQPAPDTRSYGGDKQPPQEDDKDEEAEEENSSSPTRYTPRGAAPAPKFPACKATHAILSVEGTPWRCVASTDIGERSTEEAYAYKNYINNGWATKDDFINLNFMKDAAARLYLCVTYGSAAKSNFPGPRRTAASSLVSVLPNQFYFQDDPHTVDVNGNKRGDTYSPVDGSASTELTAEHSWLDTMTDGYCVDAAEGMVANFTGLGYVKGLALSLGNSKSGYPDTGKWTYWNLKSKPMTKALAYDGAGRILEAEDQKKAWRGNARTRPPSAIHRVTMTAACNCKGWKRVAGKAAAEAKA